LIMLWIVKTLFDKLCRFQLSQRCHPMRMLENSSEEFDSSSVSRCTDSRRIRLTCWTWSNFFYIYSQIQVKILEDPFEHFHRFEDYLYCIIHRGSSRLFLRDSAVFKCFSLHWFWFEVPLRIFHHINPCSGHRYVGCVDAMRILNDPFEKFHSFQLHFDFECLILHDPACLWAVVPFWRIFVFHKFTEDPSANSFSGQNP
jgi:hypothetical protein